MDLCEHCLKFSGIYIKTNRCCTARMVAAMPPKRREAALDHERSMRGEAARERLLQEARAEFVRRRAFLRT